MHRVREGVRWVVNIPHALRDARAERLRFTFVHPHPHAQKLVPAAGTSRVREQGRKMLHRILNSPKL